jgi:hypothetical protein
LISVSDEAVTTGGLTDCTVSGLYFVGGAGARVHTGVKSTPPWRIRLKARVDLGDQTAEFIPFEVIRTAILTYFYLF